MKRLISLVERHWVDAVVAVLFAVWVGEVFLVDEIHGAPLPMIAVSLLWGLPLLLRRRHPAGAPVAVFAGAILFSLIWPSAIPYSFGSFMIFALAAGVMGATLARRSARLGGAALVLATTVVVIVRDPGGDWTNLLSVVPTFGVAWLVGYVTRVNRMRTAELRGRAERLERERDAEARAAAAEERARIAREMHDVVAHSLSVMIIQAEAAEEMIGSDPERARRPLEAVQETGRSALTELRRMLGVLREPGNGPDLAPQPGLAALDALVAQVREAGVPVSVSVEGDPRPLPATADVQAYRIVQEGLTNVLKHAGPARAEVRVRYAPDALVVEVADDGRGADPAAPHGGHGLVGMRERVAVCGGEVRAGRRPEGGFEVVARLPTGGTA